MNLILCHTTADFDTLGAAVGLTRLLEGSKIVLPGGCHPTVKDFLALHRDEYPFIERRAVITADIRCLAVVDTQQRERLGKAAQWFDLPDIDKVIVYDHHLEQTLTIPATESHIYPVGAVTTLVVQQLQKKEISLTPTEATVMALGIHVDTGSLTYDLTTPEDALALAWLMQQGASLSVVSDYIEPGLSPHLQQLLKVALEDIKTEEIRGYQVGWIILKTEDFVAGLSRLASELVDLTEIDALLLAHEFEKKGSNGLSIIGRSQIPQTNLSQIFAPLGGGGHTKAASVSLKNVNSEEVLHQVVEDFKNSIPHPPTARDLMSSPVRTILPHTTIEEAHRILLRYGHSGLSVVNASRDLVGIISRRDLDIALHHGFAHAPVKGYMSKNLKTITLDAELPEIESLMVTYDIGRLPVLENGKLLGIVTRTDVLRELHQQTEDSENKGKKKEVGNVPGLSELRSRLAPALWEFLTKVSLEAKQRGWHLYLVGGGVRDLLLANPDQPLLIPDIDMVVDGFHNAADVGAGVELASAIQQIYPGARLEVHGAFQTAALLWHNDPKLDSLWVDIATARTEFYPYPAANPVVEASSIRQDLYRRDFTINALALRLTPPHPGKLLDFFGGLLDLQAKQIRVLHPNSFIEDPTRIYRAVRFSVRLGFHLEKQTEEYIRYAIQSGVYDRTVQENSKTPALQTRLKSELKYILQASYWKPALQMLGELEALQCIHPTLKLDQGLLRQLHLMEHCLRKFDSEQQRFTHWQMRLEAIIAHLAPEYRSKVAKNLQFPDDSIKRLENLAAAKNTVVKGLNNCEKSSQVVKLLRNYDLPMLMFIALQSPRIVRRKIWHYLTVLSNVEPILNGNDLTKMGYKPGPQYKKILENLLMATLDGEVNDKSGAEEFLKRNYLR
ncbi:CBS domain-containing protein [Plectonema cf. radiosum LEGE 06105]|uniref:CBS domain-containing protein n=1 Tax=Plectonema cf. radiosum LEGE 06105 TaxID=945769 RepID=A0A8J7F603_9CYAN|nr:CBS domain-containing protein [Plectonema radiosum]MBE9216283.1 CBS domain-containing protein [Plectonema cf. radiosum LEGE 06105]